MGSLSQAKQLAMQMVTRTIANRFSMMYGRSPRLMSSVARLVGI
jgi:hypothetical protein